MDPYFIDRLRRKTPRAVRLKGQATIRREFYEAELRNTEGLGPADTFAKVLSVMFAEQSRDR